MIGFDHLLKYPYAYLRVKKRNSLTNRVNVSLNTSFYLKQILNYEQRGMFADVWTG